MVDQNHKGDTSTADALTISKSSNKKSKGKPTAVDTTDVLDDSNTRSDKTNVNRNDLFTLKAIDKNLVF